MPPMTAVFFWMFLSWSLGKGFLYALRQEVRFPEGNRLEHEFACLVVGSCLVGWLSLTLAECSLLTPSILFPLLLFAFISSWGAGLLKHWKEKGEEKPKVLDKTPFSLTETCALILWLVVALLLFFRPHETVQGAMDAGVYVNQGAVIARDGSITIHSAFLGNIQERLLPAVLGSRPSHPVTPYYWFPGFFCEIERPGTLIPQFYHLHPVWMALTHFFTSSLVHGVEASLYLPPLWGGLAAMAVYLILRQLLPRHAAFLGLAALTLSPLQVWFSRYPTSETLTQFLLWSGMWCWVSWHGDKNRSGLWAFLCGLCWGGAFLARIDMVVLLPLLGTAVLFLLWIRKPWKETLSFLLPLTIQILQSFLHGIFLARPYFLSVLKPEVLSSLHLGPALFCFGLLCLAALLLGVPFLVRWRNEPLLRKGLLLLLTVLIVGLALYGWLVRPRIHPEKVHFQEYGQYYMLDLNSESLLRLGWYVSPLGIVLCIAGTCLMLWRMDRKTCALWILGVFFSAFYLFNLRVNHIQVYAMRRHIPVALPFLTVAATYCVATLYRERGMLGRYAAVLLGTGWIGLMLFSSPELLKQTDQKGLLHQLDTLSSKLKPKSVLLFYDEATLGIGDYWGTPMTFLFEHDTIPVRIGEGLDQEVLSATVKKWQEEGRSVYWVGDPSPLASLGLRGDMSTFSLRYSVLECVYTKKPKIVLSHSIPLQITEIER